MTDSTSPILSRPDSAPEDIASDLREFSTSAEMLSRDYPRLVDKHAMQWIGVYRGKVAAIAGDLPSLIEELERRGIPPGDATIRFIEKNPRTLILQAVRKVRPHMEEACLARKAGAEWECLAHTQYRIHPC